MSERTALELKDKLIERKYTSANNASKKFFNTIHKAYLEKKKIFNWLFGENDVIPVELSNQQMNAVVDGHPRSRLIRQILTSIPDANGINLATNTFSIKKNNHKISRYVPKYIHQINSETDKKYEDLLKKLETQYFEFVKIQNMVLFDKIQKTKEKLDQLPCYMPQINFQQFYSDIKTGSGIISLLPEDIITCSTNCSYSSCLREGGEYHEGVYQYVLDKITLVAIVRNNNKNMGRQFIYIDGFNIIFGKVYGHIDNVTQTNIRNTVYEKMNKAFKLKGRWSESTEFMQGYNIVGSNGSMCSGHFGYFDGFNIVKSRNTEKGKSWRDARFHFPTPIMFNGNKMTQKVKQCSHCNKVIGPNDHHNSCSGVILCDDCYDKHATRCPYCGNSYYTEAMHKHDKKMICNNCFESRFVKCQKCGKYEQKENIVRRGLLLVCKKCAKVKQTVKNPSLTVTFGTRARTSPLTQPVFASTPDGATASW